jgi:hypothetical protein
MRISELDLARELFPVSFESASGPSTPFTAMVFAVIPASTGFQPVGGYRFLRQADPETVIHAAVLPEDTPRAELFSICLALEQALAPLNEIEKALALKEARDLFGPDDLLPAEVMSVLGLPDNRHIRDRYEAALGLDRDWQIMIAAGHPGIKVAAEIRAFDDGDRLLLLEIFQQARFTVRMQSSFLEGLRDLIKREGEELAAILLRWQIADILANPDRSPGDKGTALQACLEQDLRPGYSRDMQTFRKLKKGLGLSGEIQIETDPAFESETLRFTFEASGMDEYRARVADLLEKAEKKDFPKLFNL